MKHVEGEAVNQAVEGCFDEIQRPYEPGVICAMFGW